jgi:glycosyltransferase involved in cell wall biosynthesis
MKAFCEGFLKVPLTTTVFNCAAKPGSIFLPKMPQENRYLNETAPMSENAAPLVSIISFCRNRASMIRRSVESVLNQTYPNIEFVVQDGASTDGTLDILREYAARDARIRLVSEPDSGPAEAFWKVLHRCQGDIIGTCLSDEELLPDAVKTAVEHFSREPKLGATTGDGYISDENGKVTGDFIAGEFDFVGYLFSRYCPFWPGSFFRRQALIDVGFLEPGWNMDCIEFEIWRRLATDHEVKYFSGPVSKYAVHPTQASNTPVNFNEHVEGRISLIEKMFSADGFFGADQVLKLECMINQLFLYYNHARAYDLKEEEEKFGARIEVLKSELALRLRIAGLHRGGPNAAVADRAAQIWRQASRYVPGAIKKRIPADLKRRLSRIIEESVSLLLTGQLPYAEARPLERHFDYSWARLAAALPAPIRRLLPRRLKDAVRRGVARAILVVRFMPAHLLWLAMRLRWGKIASPPGAGIAAPPQPLHVYPTVALLYDARGQIQQALDMWRRAEPLRDETIDSLACQAILKLPGATYHSIADIQQKWADRHAQPLTAKRDHCFNPYDGRRKIRIGYHCSFMEGDTIRFIMRNVMAAHDRSQFEVYGYTPTPLSRDIKSAFDVVRETALLDTAQFVDAVRGDEIDVFVEMTGLSPGHRFVAMASRCAPVQVSYLNHHGTSRIPAVDYFLSDEMSTPTGSDADCTFSEKIYRLPDCLLCYDYEGYKHPPIVDPPSHARGAITFGYFGSGSKLNSVIIEWWAELLRRVPNSTFYLRNLQLTPADNRRYLIDRFRWFGIGPERLRIEGGTDRNSLVKCYDDVDISLDTWPYCGGNTIGESLWQGVPVVTLKGDRISSRYGASLLCAAGCADLVGETIEDYIAIATSLAGNPDRLLLLRRNLRGMCKEHNLGNSTRFARNLEKFYRDALREEMGMSS